MHACLRRPDVLVPRQDLGYPLVCLVAPLQSIDQSAVTGFFEFFVERGDDLCDAFAGDVAVLPASAVEDLFPLSRRIDRRARRAP